MRKSCCVSMEGLLYRRWRVRRSMSSWSASHWLVRPWRRSSSRIRLPMCICIAVAVCALGYRFPICIPTTTDKKRRRAISSPDCGRGIPLKGKTKYSPISEHLPLFPFEPLMKVPRFSQVGTNSKRNYYMSFFFCFLFHVYFIFTLQRYTFFYKQAVFSFFFCIFALSSDVTLTLKHIKPCSRYRK